MKQIDKGGELKAKIAKLLGKQKLLDKKEESCSLAIRKERKKLKTELAALMTETLVSSVSLALQEESLGYSESEEKADPSINSLYLFSVSLNRLRNENCEEDDEDVHDDKPAKANRGLAPQQITDYDDIMNFTRKYGLQLFNYKDCTVRFCYDSIEIKSLKGREAVFTLLEEWKAPISLARFIKETEEIETKLKSHQELLVRLQDSMLFTVGK